MSSANYVIVGGGSAGCVLANRLSADPRIKVILIEAGSSGDGFFVSMPAGWGKTTSEPGHSWHYYSAPEPTINGRRMLLPRGKGLGGSSTINGLLWVRGQPQDYESWSNLGAIGWGWADVEPLFRRIEGYAVQNAPARGTSGPLSIEDDTHCDSTSEAVLAAFSEIGTPRATDYNAADQHGAFHYQVTVKDGKRCSAADAYLRPVLSRPNLEVITGAQCRRIVFEGNRATGVEIEDKAGIQIIAAAQEVILSSGAYHSPQILMLSGIGPAEHLREHGISVLCDRPAVGSNLQEHYILTMSWRLRKGAFSYNRELSGLRILGNVLRYAVTRTGAMTIPAAQTGAFVKSDSVLSRPDIQFHCLPITGELDTGTDEKKPDLSRYPGLTLAPCVLRPESRGTVRLASANPFDVPHIQHNYLEAAEDRALSVKAIRLTRELAAAPSLAAIIEEERFPGAAAQSDKELLDYARRYGNTGYHPVGTCRMGLDDDAVLDPQLRVRGVEGLRVVDASVMPRLISGNINAATTMIAERAADMILG